MLLPVWPEIRAPEETAIGLDSPVAACLHDNSSQLQHNGITRRTFNELDTLQ